MWNRITKTGFETGASCHPERSEGSRVLAGQILRFAQNDRLRIASRCSRRGVLLLVVLSMLVLFMLIGTAFLMTSNQSRTAAKGSAKFNRLGNIATKNLDRALLQLLRDSDNVYSVIRYHSLLRDLYGTDGFQGVVTSATYARRITSPPIDNTVIGATNGQFIDLYVAPAAPPVDDANTADVDESVTLLTLQHVVKLDRDGLGRPQRHLLALTRGYYNGCVLTITSGPAAGQSSRVVDYQFVGDDTAIQNLQPSVFPNAYFINNIPQIWRFRVMTIGRKDGLTLTTTNSTPPALTDLEGETFIVNGRAFSGTGVGYNSLAVSGGPRLNAVETVQIGALPAVYPPIALMPNSAYFFPSDPDPNLANADLRGARYLDPATNKFEPLNPKITSNLTAAQITARLAQWKYPTFVGPGGANEGYDAADFQTIAMALQTVTPRAQARVVTANGIFSVDDYMASLFGTGPNAGEFRRLDLEDVPLPSFHRPDLVNYWYHQLLALLQAAPYNMTANDAVKAILQPYDQNGNLSSWLPAGQQGQQIAGLISAIKRKIILRPIREDHPHFDGGNPQSVLDLTSLKVDLTTADRKNITIPYWEACGPWDVDNDNDGVRDSNWIDLGDPIQETEDGRRYKTLSSILCIDLDSRLNVNAHGLVEDLHLPYYDSGNALNPPLVGIIETPPGSGKYTAVAGSLESGLVRQLAGNPYTAQALTAFAPGPNLAGSTNSQTYSSQYMASGLGYGPAEISLRPIFPTPWAAMNGTLDLRGNRSELAGGPVDSYKSLLVGRERLDGVAVPGRYGYEPQGLVKPSAGVTPGDNYEYAPDVPANPTADLRAPDLATQIKYFNYPWRVDQASAFGTPPDLFGRYGVGVDYAGQPFYEPWYDRNPNDKNPSNFNVRLFPSLLTDVPYEIDLCNSQRRDSWGASFSNPNAAFNQSLVQNDDAPFSPTDLEKVLRGWDSDAGTLPSRLWDVVNDFDPEKLINFDPYRVQAIASAAFGSTSQPALLAAAQQIAGINRRSVTTDSYSLPVSGASVPAFLYTAPNDVATALKPIYEAYVKRNPPKSIVEILEFRIRRAFATAGWPPTPFDDYDPNGDHDLDGTINSKDPDYSALLEVTARRVRAARISAIINGGTWYDGNTPPVAHAETGILAPDLIAGLRLDLNRPFGDGKDNPNPFTGVSDGVVDDPMEAGEPFLDVNGNGRMDYSGNKPAEPFIDLDGDGRYLPPQDKLWQGLTAETIEFDYTNGQAVPMYKSTIAGGVRNLESQARQLYARHLYCLMLLLVDENYIAPWDENDPQLMTWAVNLRKALTTAGASAAQADFIVKRKLTCRTIAQWAVNCVDMRDSDAIMTPFEYDENPWDGWGVLDQDGNSIPLDGDAATNENLGEMIDWNRVSAGRDGTPGNADDNSKVIAPSPASVTPPLPAIPSLVPTAKLPTVVNQTRGVVWGAERPELLITETLAYHERRAEDLESNDPNGHGEMKHFQNTGELKYKDADPDQGLRPRGTLMVEVQNPWSPDGQYPAELYSRLDVSTGYKYDPNVPKLGVELGRLSNFAWDEVKGRLTNAPTDAAKNIKRSPVWKMIVVEEWPDARNDDPIDEQRLDRVLPPAPFKEPQAYIDMATRVKAWKQPTATEPNPPFRPTDPDFDGTFDVNFLPKQKSLSQNLFEVQYPYVEREFYFTTDKSPEMKQSLVKPTDIDQVLDYDFSPASFKLRIPYRGVAIQYPANTKQKPRVFQTQKFIPWGLELSSLTQPVIAPIMPGRYGVIGSAGANYYLTSIDPKDAKNPKKQIYIATTGRMASSVSDSWNTDDKEHYPLTTRRIEMHPSNDPTMQQLVVGSNGGDPKDENQPMLAGNTQYDPTTQEIGRDNEMINDQGTVDNLTVPLSAPDSYNETSKYYRPCVAIPVEGMNISEPAWGYALSEVESAEFESQKKNPPTSPAMLTFKKEPNLTTKNYEGRYYGASGQNQSSYDKPFDGYPGHKTAPELLRNGTTANYRTIHLQRLANPMLPWNPAPATFKDAAGKDMYRANMPINPYRTVDSSSVNLTAFNGVSDAEANYPSEALPNAQADMLQKRQWDNTEVAEMIAQTGSFTTGTQVWCFRSTERGAWSRLNVLGSNPTPPATATSPPQRVLWAQEPAMVRFKKPHVVGSVDELYDLIPSRQVTMRVEEVPSSIKTSQSILKNRVNMVMEHTLGFGNKSFGLLYDKQGAKRPGTPTALSKSSSAVPTANGVQVASAIGAPAPCDFTWDNDGSKPAATANLVRSAVNSTYPWLAWDNRPYVSAEELLKVPAASQAQMLRQYAAIDPSLPAANRPNPYGLAELGSKSFATPVPNATRWAVMQAPFGDLANVFAASSTGIPGTASSQPADVIRDAAGAPVLMPPPPDPKASVQPYGAPNFYRILEYVQVPSRFVGTDTMLNAETFNDVPSYVSASEPIGTDITSPADPRYFFQPPFNKVSRERDPGRVNLNTVTGRRDIEGGVPHIWSEVFDGIMHRYHDANPTAQNQLGHFGPAWRDVVLSRRGYVQVDAAGSIVDKPTAASPPDTMQFGLNNNFPTLFANPFRSPDAGDLVPLVQMMQYGVDASMERVHPRNRGAIVDTLGNPTNYETKWGDPTSPVYGDARDAGFGNDGISRRLPDVRGPNGAIPSDIVTPLPPKDLSHRDTLPLFSEARDQPFADTDRNPYMMYEPMSRLGNLVTNRSGVFAVWITVGYFEVEKAPDWNDPDPTVRQNVRDHFGGDINLYNRVYPDGYMLGKELGSETGDVKRPRGFYIIDRTEEVGFKPGEDLNVEKTIRLRRRIE